MVSLTKVSKKYYDIYMEKKIRKKINKESTLNCKQKLNGLFVEDVSYSDCTEKSRDFALQYRLCFKLNSIKNHIN